MVEDHAERVRPRGVVAHDGRVDVAPLASARHAREAEAPPEPGVHGRARERGRLLRRGRSLASCAPPLQLVVRARLAGRAVAFQPAMRARLAGRAAAFQLVMRAGVAVHAVAFQLAVRARVAGRAVAFHVLVRTGVAVRAVAFELAMRARVAGRAVVFPLAVHATLASRHRLARAPRARAREKVSSLPTEAVSWLFF